MNEPANLSVLPRGESPNPDTKFGRFRRLLLSKELSFLMEAHNGLSAKIVEETGFEGIWASGLTISASLGVRDRNEASWTQVLEVLEFMSDATRVPIMLDGDTGYGDFNNFRRLVRKLEQREVAAVCIEDKVFPKTNSFIEGNQPLADIDEFCGKIKAGKDSQGDPDFCIVARIEAFIAGLGLDEALERAAAYHEAGADGILIHSRQPTADEILRFTEAWGNRAPVVIVPTKYYATPTDVFRSGGVSMVIWANHNLRAAVQAVRETSQRVFQSQRLVDVEESIASVADLFDLAGEPEMAAAERRYVPMGTGTRAVVLAASRGESLGGLTADKPKCMVDVRGEPLLARWVRSLRSRGVLDVTVVAGFKPEAIDVTGIDLVVNEAYGKTGELGSLMVAAETIAGPCVICYGDILCRDYILDLLLSHPGDIVVVIDALQANMSTDRDPRRQADLVTCSNPYASNYFENDDVCLERCSADLPKDQAHGEWIGLMKLSTRGSALVRDALTGADRSDDLPVLLNRLTDAGHPVRVVYINGDWLDVNDALDLASARNFL